MKNLFDKFLTGVARAAAKSAQRHHEALVSRFTEHVLEWIEEEREKSKTPDGVIRITRAEIAEAIDAAQYFTRDTTKKERWIIHQYLNYLESRARAI